MARQTHQNDQQSLFNFEPPGLVHIDAFISEGEEGEQHRVDGEMRFSITFRRRAYP